VAASRTSGRGARALGISILILGVVHVPLPQADFHNIRHHDAPGEICPYHDHLLLWHPSAASDDDVTLLHWHWWVPQVELADHRQNPNDRQTGPNSGPSLHADLDDLLKPDWPGETVVRPESRGRFLDHLNLGLAAASSSYIAGQLAPLDPDPQRLLASHCGAAPGLRAGRIALFQRWNC
jgi:hypothetical protein